VSQDQDVVVVVDSPVKRRRAKDADAAVHPPATATHENYHVSMATERVSVAAAGAVARLVSSPNLPGSRLMAPTDRQAPRHLPFQRQQNRHPRPRRSLARSSPGYQHARENTLHANDTSTRRLFVVANELQKRAAIQQKHRPFYF